MSLSPSTLNQVIPPLAECTHMHVTYVLIKMFKKERGFFKPKVFMVDEKKRTHKGMRMRSENGSNV